MKFRVVLPLKRPDTSDIQRIYSPYHPINPSLAYRERTLHLDETVDRYGRVMHLLDDRMWHDPVTEIVKGYHRNLAFGQPL